jgi:hypothetical protein
VRSWSSAPKSQPPDGEPLSPLPHDPGPHWGEVGIHGLHRPREWDEVVLVESPSALGDRLVVVVLPDGSLVVEEGARQVEPGELVSPLELQPPYRLEAVRRSGATWAVGARRILVARLAGVSGDELELVWDGSSRTMRIDGIPTVDWVPALAEIAAARYGRWVVRAYRLRDDLWEVEIGSL